MQIIDVEQDSIEWRKERRGYIGGSDVKKVLPKARGGDPEGFWEKIGERLTVAPEDMSERAMDRGHRLEDEAIGELETIIGLTFKRKPGIFRTDSDNFLQLSPDGAEDSENPTYAAEIKCLGAGKHFKVLHSQMFSSLEPIDLIPNEYSSSYREQVINYFTVPSIKTVYFAMYLPEAIYSQHRMIVLVIQREDVEEEIAQQQQQLLAQAKRINDIVERLVGDDF